MPQGESKGMSVQERPPVGLVVGSALTPEQFRQMAVGERLGFGELWVVEDYFFHGGIADAAVALSATDSVPVGIGDPSGLVRRAASCHVDVRGIGPNSQCIGCRVDVRFK